MAKWVCKDGVISDTSDAKNGGLYLRGLFAVLPEALPEEMSIAVAAPDLLAACGLAIEALETLGNEAKQKHAIAGALHALHAVILKATEAAP